MADVPTPVTTSAQEGLATTTNSTFRNVLTSQTGIPHPHTQSTWTSTASATNMPIYGSSRPQSVPLGNPQGPMTSYQHQTRNPVQPLLEIQRMMPRFFAHQSSMQYRGSGSPSITWYPRVSRSTHIQTPQLTDINANQPSSSTQNLYPLAGSGTTTSQTASTMSTLSYNNWSSHSGVPSSNHLGHQVMRPQAAKGTIFLREYLPMVNFQHSSLITSKSSSLGSGNGGNLAGQTGNLTNNPQMQPVNLHMATMPAGSQTNLEAKVNSCPGVTSTAEKMSPPYTLHTVYPSRSVNFDDPLENKYRIAEGHFRRMMDSRQITIGNVMTDSTVKIRSIDIINAPALEEQFKKKKCAFQRSGIPTEEVLAYHGTDVKNISSILTHNLSLSFSKRFAYGHGIYFSEFPDISIGYGNGLLLCRIMPGHEYIDRSSSNIPDQYHSKKVLPHSNTDPNFPSGEVLVIKESHQILPTYIIHLEK